MTLEEQVRELYDKDQIREMQALYIQREADRDVDGWCALFAETGAYVNPRGNEFVGISAIRKNLTDRIASNPEQCRTSHICGPVVVTVTGDSASSVCDYIAYGRLGPDSPWYVAAVGRIHTQLVRHDAGWRFTEVRNRAYFPERLPFPSADYQSGVVAVDR